jgi:hypothetical protein
MKVAAPSTPPGPTARRRNFAREDAAQDTDRKNSERKDQKS